ncbi:hypothetical protein N7G274_001205 [Stereocaulon virgatum]|uniref:SprT-like domain-containing protein n=1 Tax=Stereocaulon virgatum TaxID=373712 RepID=A0ABR4ANS7_9LECA
MAQTQPVVDALRRLQIAREGKSCGPHLIIKAARDIDTAFFGSQLWGNTIIRWEYKPEHPNLTTLYGHTKGHPGGRAVITLNAAILFKAEDPCEEMWRTMLHEMVHAFQFVTCGNFTDNDADELPPYELTSDELPPYQLLPEEQSPCHLTSRVRALAVTEPKEIHQEDISHGWNFRFVIALVDGRARQYLNLKAIADDEMEQWGLCVEREEDQLKREIGEGWPRHCRELRR